MKNILIVFFIFFFIITIIVFPFKIRLMGHFNLMKLIGFYSLKIMFLRLLTGRIVFKDGKINIENSVNIVEDGFNSEFSKQFINEILKRIDIKKIEVYFTGGITNNSFSSAIICGSVSSIVQSIYSYLSQKFYKIKLYEDIDPTFNENNLEITFDIVISISLIAIVISVFSAFIKQKKEINKWKIVT